MQRKLGRGSVPLSSSNERPGLSRRRFLQSSAVAAGSTLLVGCSSPSQAQDWGVANIPSQAGRYALVTGGNGYPMGDISGLGYHTALQLARAGADVTIASRKADRGAEAVRLIREAAPDSEVRFEQFDLTDLASVNAFTERMNSEGRPLDMLVNNAGVMGRLSMELSEDGHERVFATNTLGHFAMTGQLMPLMRDGSQTRVVWVSSSRASREPLDFETMRLPDPYDYGAAYNYTKLAAMELPIEMERRSRAAGWAITSVAAHPGVARTHLIPDGPGPNSMEGRRLRTMGAMFPPAEEGAVPLLFATTWPEAQGGHYYGPTGGPMRSGPPGENDMREAALDPEASAALWTWLEELSGVSYG